jgi:Sfi1 spindle body protein
MSADVLRSAVSHDWDLGTRSSARAAYSDVGTPTLMPSPFRLALSRRWLTERELRILRDIVHSSTDANDGASFLAIFKAYDAILQTHNIDPSTDRIYFKSLLRLARLNGATWVEKFDSLLSVPTPIIASLTLLTYSQEMGSQRRGTKNPAHPPSSHPDSDRTPERPHVDQPSRTASETGISRTRDQIPSNRRPRSAVDAASSSRHRVESPTLPHSDFTLNFDGDPRRYTILRQYWHAWRAKAIRRRTRVVTMEQLADRHYRSILLPVTLETWKAKWRYFAILTRRVGRDRIRTILLRCLTWWKFKLRQSRLQDERIHNEVSLRRAFSAWLTLVRIKQEHMNTRTLSNVMQRWKSKASTNRDLSTVAERCNRQRLLRRFWKDWFFQTCSVKTVQYYQIKLKQRALGAWLSKHKRVRKMQRLAHYTGIRKLATTFLLHWECTARNVLDRIELADLLRQRRLLTTSLNKWRKAQHLSIRAGLLSDKIDNKYLVRSWRRWRDLTYALHILRN